MNVNYRQNKAGQGHTQCNDTSEAMYGNAMGSAMGINACKATQWKITQRANLWQCDGQCNGPQMLGCVHCDLQGRHAEEDSQTVRLAVEKGTRCHQLNRFFPHLPTPSESSRREFVAKTCVPRMSVYRKHVFFPTYFVCHKGPTSRWRYVSWAHEKLKTS